MRSICVFCGSSPGASASYQQSCESLADALLARDMTLVYGGARVGTMGMLASHMLAGGGRVIGVIPQALVDIEVAHDELTELLIVADMHARKKTMADRSDAFIALPGGLGTLEELFEVLTWSQLGFQQKAAGLLNVQGYYDSLLGFLDHARDQGFIRDVHRDLLLADTDASRLLDRLEQWVPPAVSKL